MFTRTLNEIHKCVLPREDEYRVFKTPEEVALSVCAAGSSTEIELKDPRRNPTQFMKPSYVLIRDYGYSSELTPLEHRMITDAISINIKHNPKLLKQNKQNNRNIVEIPQETPQEVIEKFKTETIYFNKCAEIFYYRHISEFNSLVGDDMKRFLVNRWTKAECNDLKFQVVTMLLRDQFIDGDVETHVIESQSEEFIRKAYLIPDDFPSLNRFTAEDLRFYSNLKRLQRTERDYNEHDAILPLDLLAKLITDTELFSVRFDNQENQIGKLCSVFHNPLPLKSVSIEEALEEVLATEICMNIDWHNMNADIKLSENVAEYRGVHIEDVLKKLYFGFKKKSGVNEATHVWKFNKGSQIFKVALMERNRYFIKSEDGAVVPVNVSIKLEYQTRFGAEKMTKQELMKEWCGHKFSLSSETLRFRVDANTLTTISITRLSLNSLQKELLDNHNTHPNQLLQNLVNLFSCIQRLPQDSYLIQTKIEDACKKLFIFKADDNGKLMDDPWEISSSFTRSWIPIDDTTPTFIHVNQYFTPCSFPIAKQRNRLSYLPKPNVAAEKKKAKAIVKKAAMVKKLVIIKKKKKKKRRIAKQIIKKEEITCNG